jgi:hypothetical protein
VLRNRQKSNSNQKVVAELFGSMRFVLSGTAIISCVALHGNEICKAEGAVAAELEADCGASEQSHSHC